MCHGEDPSAADRAVDQLPSGPVASHASAQVSVERKQHWIDLLLQHAVSETVARSCIRDVADQAQLIAKVKALESSDEGVERLLQVLSFPLQYKRLWLNVFLSHGLSADFSKAFLSDIKGGLPDLEKAVPQLPIPGDLAKTLIAKVCDEVW